MAKYLFASLFFFVCFYLFFFDSAAEERQETFATVCISVFIVAIVAALLDLVITLVNTIGLYLIDMTVKTMKKAQSSHKTEFSIKQSPKIRNIDSKTMAD